MPRETTLIALLLAISLPAQAQVLESDSLALMTLYDSTDGANWTNTWDLNTPVDTWYGVTVSGGRMTVLSLNSIQLTGSIPAELGNLANLTSLNLYTNQLSGSIPAEIGNLTTLQEMFLHNNLLTGPIPPEIGDLANLQYLLLGPNLLTGSIPPEIGSLKHMRILILNSNQLSGPIPPEISSLTNIWHLRLSGNQLTDPIPPELGGMTNLQDLRLYANQLSGSIPAELGDLPHLRVLYLHENRFSGLPDLNTLTALNYLRVENNRLTFEDLEPNIGVASTVFTYAPQDSVGNDSAIVWGLNGNLTISVPVGGTANVYQWMKDGVDIPGATGDTLRIFSVAYADSGSYVLRLTNTIVPDLTLYSRPTRLKVVANQEPALAAVPDTTIQEDDTLRIVLHGSDIYGDPLTYGATSDTNAVATMVDDSLLTIIPEPQWNGVANIFVTLSDGPTTVRDTFDVAVEPVNDPPGPFALLEPPADTLIHRVNEAIWDTVIFRWERALDVEGNSVTYHFVDVSDRILFEAQSTADTILYLIPGIDVLGINYAFVNTFTIVWSVTAHDGIDSTVASNGPDTFLLVIDYSNLSIDEDGALPKQFALHQNYPNPFNPTTTIRFDLPVATEVHLAVYDLLGREVVRLVDRRLKAGFHRQVWNARDAQGRELPTGMYIAFIATPEFTKSIKVVLLK
ncbi:MAG: T9SS type A sorting domain-containing protein [Candidatus Neomarinimicrobiota bacterium]